VGRLHLPTDAHPFNGGAPRGQIKPAHPTIGSAEAKRESKVQRKGAKESNTKNAKEKREESIIFKRFFAFFLSPPRLCV